MDVSLYKEEMVCCRIVGWLFLWLNNLCVCVCFHPYAFLCLFLNSCKENAHKNENMANKINLGAANMCAALFFWPLAAVFTRGWFLFVWIPIPWYESKALSNTSHLLLWNHNQNQNQLGELLYHLSKFKSRARNTSLLKSYIDKRPNKASIFNVTNSVFIVPTILRHMRASIGFGNLKSALRRLKIAHTELSCVTHVLSFTSKCLHWLSSTVLV